MGISHNRTGRLSEPSPAQLVTFTILLVIVLGYAPMEPLGGRLLAR